MYLNFLCLLRSLQQVLVVTATAVVFIHIHSHSYARKENYGVRQRKCEMGLSK